MTFSYTGLAYLLGFFAIGLLTYRFFQYWQGEKTVVSKIFFYFTATFAFFMLITGIAGLFFAENTKVLKLVVILATFIQTIALSTIGYLLIYLKLPRISPWWGVVAVSLLGLASTVVTIITPFHPYLEENGGINWDIQPLADNLRLSMFVITFLPLIILLIQQIRTSQDPLIKTKAFGLGVGLFLGIITGFFDFFLEPALKLTTISSDIAMGALSIIIFIIVFFFQKPPLPKEAYAPPPPPIIRW